MSNLKTNLTSLEALIDKANALPEAKTLQSSKTVTPSTSSQTVTPDSGYDGLEKVTVNAMPTATQATPSVSINSSTGKVTATATQTAGYVAAGTKTGTLSLTTQAAKTVTPTKSSQTAVAAGRYTTGAVTVAAIPNQYMDVSNATAVPYMVAKGQTFLGGSGEQVGTLDIDHVHIIDIDSDGAVDSYITQAGRICVESSAFGDAKSREVLAGAKFTSGNSEGTAVAGTMPNNGDTSQTFDGLETTSVTIPAGYTSGGTVALDSTISETADSQADLIEQISVALAGKSVSGGSGTSVETCEVTVNNCYNVFYTGLENGELVAKMSSGTSTTSTHTFTACRNSAILCGNTYGSFSTGSSSGALLLSSYGTYYSALELTDSTVEITLNGGISGGSG